MTNNKNIIDKYFINKERTFAFIHIINDEGTFKLILPLVFKDYDFKNIDQCISILSENFNGYSQMTRNINKIIKMCFKYLDKYIDTLGNLQNIKESDLIEGEKDEDDDIDELLRVFVKTLKINSMEVCSNCGDYFLVYKKKIYNYDKDKMNLNLSNIENLKETKHLYGCRLFDFKNNNFYGDVDTKKFTSLIPCADSDDEMNNLNDTETENKISALKKLCGILKNMNETDSPKPTTRKNYDSSAFLKSSSQKKSSNKKKYKEESSESEDINVESLREKIKRLNSKKNKKSYDSDYDKNYFKEEKEHEYEHEEDKKKEEPTQLQQMILYFLTNPDSLPKLIDSVNNTIDSFTDNLNPTKLLGRNRPLRIQKYFSNVNLVLKYIEMLKIIELKYKQTLEFRCNCDDFVLEDESTYFNDHLNKIWDMVKLIICELSALRLNSITCSTPQCEDIKFNSADLFVKDNKNYKKILERIGFATEADGSMDNSKIFLEQAASKTLLINTISQHQRIMVNGFRKYMNNAYQEFENSMAHINQDIITSIENCITESKTFDNMKTVEDGTDVSSDALLTALKTQVDAVTSFNLTKFLDTLKTVVKRAYSFTTDQLKATGANNHYALGVNYGTEFDYVTEIATTIKTDTLLGALYVVKKSSNTLKDKIEDLVEKLLKSGKASNDFTADLVNLSEIRALSSKCELSEEYLSASTNLLQYITDGVLTSVTFDTDGDGNISRGEFKNALDNVYDSTGTKNKYYEILYLSFSSLATFKSELTDKSDKDVIILRRKKLINFLKQLENDTNLSLSFFGEMASSYNTTTDSKAINAPPDVFVNIFKNHQQQHKEQHHEQQYHHSQPNPFSSFGGDNHHRAEQQQQQQQQKQPYQEPASARTAGSNDILRDSDDNYDDTTDDESDTGFKLRDSPKASASSFRKTYTGSKRDYN